MSWQEWVQLVAVVVAALAALVALRYARQTVRESRELRREDRLSRLADVAGDFGTVLAHTSIAAGAEMKLPSARARLRAHVLGAGEPLPACEALLAVELSASPDFKTTATDAALDEIGTRLGARGRRGRWSRPSSG